MAALVVFVLILLSFGGIVLGVGALILLLNRGEKAEEIKALLEGMWIDLKDLSVRFVRLYNLLAAFVKELIQREPEVIDEVAKAEDVTSVAIASEAGEAATHECIVEEKENNDRSEYWRGKSRGLRVDRHSYIDCNPC